MSTAALSLDLDSTLREIRTTTPVLTTGSITEVRGPSIKATIPGASVGDLVSIAMSRRTTTETPTMLAQVAGFSEQQTVLSPFGSTDGITPGARVTLLNEPASMSLGPRLLGSVLDGLGQTILPNTGNATANMTHLPYERGSLDNNCPSALTRKPVDSVFSTGIRAIDAFITLGRGQRLGVFAEPGVGKSTLLGMIASHSSAEVNVIGLIGERGREVREFIEQTIDPETRKRTVLVISTSDESAMQRISAALTATRVAEYFRDQGKNVLLQMDSLTRLFRAYREVGLAAGELPVRRGYPPSVFTRLPRLIERAGTNDKGSITALYTILLSADLDEDPMVEEVKGLTDGHLILSRELAEQNHYPAIDVVSSLSRLQNKLFSTEPLKQALKASCSIKSDLARIKKDRDMIALGGQADRQLSAALAKEESIRQFLQQETNDFCNFEDTMSRLVEMSRS